MKKLSKEKLLARLALIDVLKKCPKDARSQIIDYLNSEGINVLSETIHNVLRKETPLKDSQKKRLIKEYSKNKNVLLQIAKRKGSFKNKKKLFSWVRLRGPVIQANGRLTYEDDLMRSVMIHFNECQCPH